nr:Flp family type IVb pilin [Duganella sp. CY15W]
MNPVLVEAENTLIQPTLTRLIINAIKHFIRDEDGITAIEYALMAAAIAAAITAGLAILGPKLTASLTYISGLIKSS